MSKELVTFDRHAVYEISDELASVAGGISVYVYANTQVVRTNAGPAEVAGYRGVGVAPIAPTWSDAGCLNLSCWVGYGPQAGGQTNGVCFADMRGVDHDIVCVFNPFCYSNPTC